MPDVLLIADDLTGAADSGVTFARHGARALVIWEEGGAPEADVLILSTESRRLAQADAVRRVREQVVGLIAAAAPSMTAAPWIYKKIDSTLRGHPGPELATVMAVMGAKRALVAPAFPAQGRTTVGGVHYVRGTPLTETVFGREVSTADVGRRMTASLGLNDQGGEVTITPLPLDRVRQGAAAVSAFLARCEGWVIADAETGEDMLSLAEAALRSETRLLCGSAGLANALAALLAGSWSRQPASPRYPDPPPTRVLVVAASRHPQMLAQIAAARAAGLPVISPDPESLTADHDVPPDRAAVERVRAALASVGTAVLTTAGLPDLPVRGELVADRLASLARRALEVGPRTGLVLTGGDVAIAVSRALGAAALRLQGEVLPGIPWGYLVAGHADGVAVVTKAGGFGEDGALLASIRCLGPVKE
jgi:uncharacterized protein YgbK (DUF1537 family)